MVTEIFKERLVHIDLNKVRHWKLDSKKLPQWFGKRIENKINLYLIKDEARFNGLTSIHIELKDDEQDDKQQNPLSLTRV